MEQFIQQLMTDQGINGDIDADVRQEIAAELTEQLTSMINRTLIDAMDDAAVTEFEQLIDAEQPDQAALNTFVKNHVPNHDEIVAATLIEFRASYLGSKA
jgi:hypothetical protein